MLNCKLSLVYVQLVYTSDNDFLAEVVEFEADVISFEITCEVGVETFLAFEDVISLEAVGEVERFGVEISLSLVAFEYNISLEVCCEATASADKSTLSINGS